MTRLSSRLLVFALMVLTSFSVNWINCESSFAAAASSAQATATAPARPSLRIGSLTKVHRTVAVTVASTCTTASGQLRLSVQFQRFDVASQKWIASKNSVTTLAATGAKQTVTFHRAFATRGIWRVRAGSREGTSSVAYSGWKDVHVCGNRPIALTFDDGPDARDTPKALAALKRHRARATFFFIGRRANKYPTLVRAVAKDGHQLGNHRYTHQVTSSKLSTTEFRTELVRTNSAIKRALDTPSEDKIPLLYPIVFRYPWGAGTSRTDRVVAALGMRKYGWDYGPGDGGTHGPLSEYVTSLIARKVLANTGPYKVILMHDSPDRPNTVAALPRILRTLESRGYDFVTLEELRQLKAMR